MASAYRSTVCILGSQFMTMQRELIVAWFSSYLLQTLWQDIPDTQLYAKNVTKCLQTNSVSSRCRVQ